MKLTLFDMVDDILNDMDADKVNSIFDTFESEQVAQIIKSTYLAMMSNRNWPHQRKAISLKPSGDPNKPTHMSIKDNVKELIFLNYNNVKSGETRKRYEPVKWMEPDDFLRRSNLRDSDEPNILVVVDPTGVEMLVGNDKKPEYYTSFDDENLVFDSYDSEVDSTLQESKVQGQAYVMSTWTNEDDFIPELPEEAFTALLEESKSRAMFKLKQMTDSKAEQESSRQQRWLARRAWRVEGGIKFPDYGRASRKHRRDPTFRER